MWNKRLALLLEPSYKRFGIALCASALLHLILVGKFYGLLLPDNKPALHTIEARLQLPKPTAKPAPLPAKPPKHEKLAKAKPVKTLKPARPKPTKPEPIEPELITPELITPKPSEPSPVESAAATAESSPVDLTAPNQSEPSATAGTSNDISDPNPKSADVPVEAQGEQAPLHKSAYQFVETTFKVSTEIGGSSQGTATMTYNLLDGTHYQINSVAKARGLAALVLSELVQTSEGVLTDTGLQPNKFTYNYGDKASKSRLATFNWQTKTVNLQTAKGLQTDVLPIDTQDLLSFMYQFMFVPPLEKMHINVVNGKSLRTYDYSFEGEETPTLPIGEVKTVHIQHSNADTEDKIDLWLAVDYQYLPVKILKIDKNGKIYEFTAVNLKTTPDVPAPPINY
ncbi:MAG: DUF3108 domain-containing protein [Bdellovibrio sp.]|nr:DUF3108 domain-containing protein [Methylotenera sp.]